VRQDKTEIVCVVDRSGSMERIKEDAIGGFNAFLAKQKEEPGEAQLTLVMFDNEYEVRADGAPIRDVQPLCGGTFVPRGSTALYDAVGRTIVDVGARLERTPEAERPGKVIVLILTDGMENASKEFSRERVRDMIKHQRERYSWEFVFIAAGEEAFRAGRGLNIDHAVQIKTGGRAQMDAYVGTSEVVKSYRQSGMVDRGLVREIAKDRSGERKP
jgi:hypothetical protein